MTERVLAPFGPAQLRGGRQRGRPAATGSSRRSIARGPSPRAGQFYMLATERWGGAGRAALPAARVLGRRGRGRASDGVRLDFLLEAVGPGTERLAALAPRRRAAAHRPARAARSRRPPSSRRTPPGRSWSAAGSGSRRWRSCAASSPSAASPQRVLLGFRDRAHSGGLELFRCSEVRTASEDGHTGHQGYVTDLLAVLLEGDDAGSAAVYACGPPAMLEAVRELCAERGVAAELAMETPMACGFGSCFGCAVPLAAGGYMRLCVDGPVVRARRGRDGAGGRESGH